MWTGTLLSEDYVLSEYSLPNLERRVSYALPTVFAETGIRGWATAIEVDDAPVGGRLVALSGGLLTVWDTKTGEMLGEPVRLGTSNEDVQWYRGGDDFVGSDIVSADIITRPEHPEEVAIVAPNDRRLQKAHVA